MAAEWSPTTAVVDAQSVKTSANRRSRPWIVSDELWSLIEPLLPKPSPKKAVGRPRVPDQQALSGILFVPHTGIQWDYLLPGTRLRLGRHAHPHRARPGRSGAPAARTVRPTGPRRRRGAALLRPSRRRRARLPAEVRRGRHPAARPRAGRAGERRPGAGPGRAGQAADVRGGGRRVRRDETGGRTLRPRTRHAPLLSEAARAAAQVCDRARGRPAAAAARTSAVSASSSGGSGTSLGILLDTTAPVPVFHTLGFH